MLKTSTVELSESWASLLGKTQDRRMTDGLSRFARWASERQISPRDVDREVVDRFVAELYSASLVRKIAELGQTIVRSWNRLVRSFPEEGLQPIKVRRRLNGPARFPWQLVRWAEGQWCCPSCDWLEIDLLLGENNPAFLEFIFA